MYRSSSDYRFVMRPGRRRGSINELIEKYNVLSESSPSQSANNLFNYNNYNCYQEEPESFYSSRSKMYRQQHKFQNKNNDYDSNEIDDYNQDEVISSSTQLEDPNTVLSRLAGIVLPFWLILKPVLTTVTVAPLPLFFSLTGTGIFALLLIFILPRTFSEILLYPGFRLVFGTLYPAYASYKAVRTKNVKEYVKWMMYWIVFAFFTCIETFTDIFLSWFPFYYEIKVILVIWLLSPATKGSSTLYRKFVHPMLTKREQEIDEYINQAKEKGYTAVLQLGSKGINYATTVVMQTAIKAFQKGQLDLALMAPAQSLPNGMNHVGRHRDNDDATDAPYHTTTHLTMQRSFSMDSALNNPENAQIHINGYDSIIYEVESESEEQEFLRGDSESETTSAARARIVPKRKTQAVTKRGRGRPAGPRARRNVRESSMEGGGGLVQSIRKSYSLSDLSEPEQPRSKDDIDATVRMSAQQQQRMLRSQTRNNPMRARPNVEMSFPELDLQMKHQVNAQNVDYDYIRSTDNISSGYSSAEPGLSRAGSITSTAKPRLRSKNRSEESEGNPFEIEAYLINEDRPSRNRESERTLPSNLTPQDMEKYVMFLQWLENNKKIESNEKLEHSLTTKAGTSFDSDGNSPENREELKKIDEKKDDINNYRNVEIELKVPQSQYRRSVSPIEQRLDTVEQELKSFTLEKTPENDDEFQDVIDDDDDDEGDLSITEMSEPTASTVIENPDWTAQMLEKIENLADSLTKTSHEDTEIASLVTVEPKLDEKMHSIDTKNEDLPNEIQIGQKIFRLEDKKEEDDEIPSDNPGSDEEIVLESKLIISNSHVELTTLKTSSSRESLNKIGSRRSSLSNSTTNLNMDLTVSNQKLAKSNSLTNISSNEQKPANEQPERIISHHTKGKAPVPPVMPKPSPSNFDAAKPPLPIKPNPNSDRSVKEKKRKSGGLFSSFTGIFKSDHNKDNETHDENPKETRI
uniref:CSON015501 protein n=1 Tax=Culicoides sonorensis TaxID=179676 RepID=A0A336LPW0_CULSO